MAHSTPTAYPGMILIPYREEVGRKVLIRADLSLTTFYVASRETSERYRIVAVVETMAMAKSIEKWILSDDR